MAAAKAQRFFQVIGGQLAAADRIRVELRRGRGH